MSDTTKRDAVLRAFDCAAPYSPAEKNMADRIVRLQEAVARVRALHKLPPNTFESVWFGNDGQVLLLVCNECGENHPCPTLRALEGTP